MAELAATASGMARSQSAAEMPNRCSAKPVRRELLSVRQRSSCRTPATRAKTGDGSRTQAGKHRTETQ